MTEMADKHTSLCMIHSWKSPLSKIYFSYIRGQWDLCLIYDVQYCMTDLREMLWKASITDLSHELGFEGYIEIKTI